MTEPLPCPFCGNEDLDIQTNIDGSFDEGGITMRTTASYMFCKCGCSFGPYGRDEIVDKWNCSQINWLKGAYHEEDCSMGEETQEPAEHHLKTWPSYFEEIARGNKTFDLRENDRGFREGDILVLEEWDPKTKLFSGRQIIMQVGFMVQGEWGLSSSTCAMSLLIVEAEEDECNCSQINWGSGAHHQEDCPMWKASGVTSPGLDAMIKAGQVDAKSNQPCPPLDSDIAIHTTKSNVEAEDEN